MRKLFFGSLIVLCVFSLHSCKTNKTTMKTDENTRPKVNEITNLKDDQGNYVYLEKDGSFKVNEIVVDQFGICQALLNQQAFNWSIVLSPSKATSEESLEDCRKDIISCYEKFKMVKAVDAYDKIYKDLNDEQRANVDKWYPLHLIVTAPRK